SAAERRATLRRLIEAELADPDLAKVRVSVVARELLPRGERALRPLPAPAVGGATVQALTSASSAPGGSLPSALRRGTTLIAVAPDARRVPASNAKLLTTVAAAKLLAGHVFRTEVLRRGSRVFLRGSGDPLLSEKDLLVLARKTRAAGVRTVRHVYIDDTYFSRRRLAPGFEKFLAGSPYRPTSGALNVGANAVQIRVSAARGRRQPRVDVFPPSDYVKVKKRVRFSRARRGKAARQRKISIHMKTRGSILWLTISGVMGRKAKTFVRRRAIPSPGLNAGWAFRRALKKVGVRVSGIVSRGRAPRKGHVVARRARSLSTILKATNLHSHNLAAETLIRTMGRRARSGKGKGHARRGRGRTAWALGLVRATLVLRSLGLRDFSLKNGSGLHRSTTVTAETMVRLLEAVWHDKRLHRVLLPTLSRAGQSGTLGGRMRHTVARGVIRGKTGTLGSVLALSGYALPPKKMGAATGTPLAFSILINGSARRRVRRHIDRIAVLLARYALGRSLEDNDSQPAHDPVRLRSPDPGRHPVAPQPAAPPPTTQTPGGTRSGGSTTFALAPAGSVGKMKVSKAAKAGPPRRVAVKSHDEATALRSLVIPPLPKLPPRKIAADL
ncbi:MAG: D-alanyl-D-alanine carboxypeptidase/D-alanyl-D-alanine-endopeptidase, partial [Deltaproteobacteria bacterium]|nr:D-alanyl-D-alanine carboxypeptidase/D-alanyl-D-alanine-endopeptidase [Deltaproteobacteria bacterium]